MKHDVTDGRCHFENHRHFDLVVFPKDQHPCKDDLLTALASSSPQTRTLLDLIAGEELLFQINGVSDHIVEQHCG